MDAYRCSRLLGEAALDDPAQRRRSLRGSSRRSAPALRSGSPRACRSRSSSGTRACPSPSRRGSSRTRTGPSGSRAPARSPARATCSRPSPRRRPASSPSSSAGSTLAAPGDRSSVSFARPKSRILTSPSFVTITFSGFRSRWTIPASCAAARPSAICGAIWSSFLIGSGAARERAPAASSRPPAPSRCRRRRSRRPDVVDRDDVGMIQRRGRPRFLLEPLQPLRIRRQRLRQHLDRHLARQTRVPRPVHLPHPARAERREDLVGSQASACGQRHVERSSRRILSLPGAFERGR